MRKAISLAAASWLALLAAATPWAEAQTEDATNAEPTWRGPAPDKGGRHLIGFGIAVGSLRIGDGVIFCDSCSRHAPTVELNALWGGLFLGKVAMIFEGAVRLGNRDPRGNENLGNPLQASISVGAQYWWHQRIWTRAAFGAVALTIPSLEPDVLKRRNDGGYGLSAAAGFEMLSLESTALTLEARAVGTRFDPGEFSTFLSLGLSVLVVL